MKQKTIENKISFTGIGIHSGVESTVTLFPSKESNGIRFIRTDVKNKNNIIKAHYSNISSCQLCTSLSNSDQVSVSTGEHLLATLNLKGIFNVDIHIDNEEVPILDGSGASFLFGIESAGIKEFESVQKKIYIEKELILKNDHYNFKVTPNNKSYLVAYKTSKFFLNQNTEMHYQFDLNSNLITDIIKARTFCDTKDIDKVKSLGMGKGGHINNTLIIDSENKIIKSDEKLRYPDETIRHKVLDFIGDISLLGLPIQATFECEETGHASNKDLMTAIMSNPENYRIDK